MMWFIRSLCLSVLLSVGSSAWGSDRVALVIGVGSYPYLGPLQRPPNDAEDVADFLDSKGYHVHVVHNARTKDEIQQKADEFLADLRARAKTGPTDGLIYYSGHGFEAEHNNWLIAGNFDPTGYRPGDRREVFKKYAISLNSLLTSTSKTGANAVVVVLDACRDTRVEFADSTMVSVGFDIANSAIPSRFFTILASSRELPAYSSYPGDAGRNSVFTHFFLSRLEEESYELSALLNKLQDDVEKATASKKPIQSPAGFDGISGNYFIYPPVENQTAPSISQQGPTINVFYNNGRESDAQSVTNGLREAGVFYGVSFDNFSQVKVKLPSGSYRIVRSSKFSPADQIAFDKTIKVLESQEGSPHVVVQVVDPANIINKPFQVQLY